MVLTCRRELLDRTLIWNQAHLLHALREFEQFYNAHRHQAIANARPLRALPPPVLEPDAPTWLHIHRLDRLGGILHEYQHDALPARMRSRQAHCPDGYRARPPRSECKAAVPTSPLPVTWLR